MPGVVKGLDELAMTEGPIHYQRCAFSAQLDAGRLYTASHSWLGRDRCEIAHLKMALDADNPEGGLSVVSLVGNDAVPDLRESLPDRIVAGKMIVNLRAQAEPEILRRVTNKVLNGYGRSIDNVTMELEHLECFRPAKPAPPHRMTVCQ